MNLQPFFDSIISEGGQLAVVIFMLIFLSSVAFFMHETGHDPAETGRVLISSAFSSLMTLFLTKLGGKKT